jgi:glycosyltransferase involved in cell wall biosynthesis
MYLAGGNYWEDPMIDETIKNLKLQDRVKKLGFVSDEALPEYYRGAAALVVPSFHEGFCMPAAEAIACGCPVITTNSSVMKEVLGDAGVFVDPTSSEEIADALGTLAYNAKKRANLSLKGHMRATKYAWSNLGSALLHEINSVASL